MQQLKQFRTEEIVASRVNSAEQTMSPEAAAAAFIADFCRDLANTARANQLPVLAHLLDMAHTEATETVSSSKPGLRVVGGLSHS